MKPKKYPEQLKYSIPCIDDIFADNKYQKVIVPNDPTVRYIEFEHIISQNVGCRYGLYYSMYIYHFKLQMFTFWGYVHE
jgi:hypothetical protein